MNDAMNSFQAEFLEKLPTFHNTDSTSHFE